MPNKQNHEKCKQLTMFTQYLLEGVKKLQKIKLSPKF
jgi:hypothetical protein